MLTRSIMPLTVFFKKFALCKNPLWLLAAQLHRSLAQALTGLHSRVGIA